MGKFLVVTLFPLLWIVGCVPAQLTLSNGEIGEAPKGTIVIAMIKMPDGRVERVDAKRWRIWKMGIEIETEDKTFFTGVNNVVMFYDHPKLKESK